MDALPRELVLEILEACVRTEYGNKNHVLDLRRVCKLFDELLKPVALRTLQLEFTRLDKESRYLRRPDEDALRRAGAFCQALYLDMMVVRDEGEVEYFGRMFARVPSMQSFVSELRTRYCMNEANFTEIEYRDMLGRMLECTPNVTAVRLNLPFQLLAEHSRSATMLMGNTFDALAQRLEGSKTLKTLVLENTTERAINSLWRNPHDVKNIMDSVADLEHLLISVRRDEDGPAPTAIELQSQQRLWEMIGAAKKLQSLCIIGLDLQSRPFVRVKVCTPETCSVFRWYSRSLPALRSTSALSNLTCLELRGVKILSFSLLSTLQCLSYSLQELYLDHVYLKKTEGVFENHLWIGIPNAHPPSEGSRWIALALRGMRLHLRVLRVSNLGYDQYSRPGGSPPIEDLDDPCGLGRSLEQRFVEVVNGYHQPPAPDGSPVAYWPEQPTQDWVWADKDRPEMDQVDWNAALYLRTQRNPTSAWQKAIDGQFPNCNKFTLDELHEFANRACEGMNEVNRRTGQPLIGEAAQASDDD